MRLYSLGFELQSEDAFVEYTANNGTGLMDIQTTTKRSGAASMRLHPTADYFFIGNQFRATATGKVFARVYMKIDSLPDDVMSFFGLGVGTGSTFSGIQARLETDGTVTGGYYDGTFHTTTGASSAINDGNWHRIEISYDDDTDTAEILVDGSSIVSQSTANLGGFDSVYVGSMFDSVTCDIYFDDLAVNDTSGSYQTSWPGSGKIVHLRPNGNGDNNDCDSGDYSSVDEITPDNATSYANFNNDGDILDVALDDYTTPGIGASDTITLVHVGTRDACASAAAATYVQRIKSQASGTLLESGTINHNDTTYKTVGQGEGSHYGYQLTSYVDPQSGGAWTPALLSTAQIGVRATDTTPNIRLTTLWAVVEYVEGAPAGTVIKDVIGLGMIPHPR